MRVRVSIDEVACYRTERALMGCTRPLRYRRGSVHPISVLELTKNEVVVGVVTCMLEHLVEVSHPRDIPIVEALIEIESGKEHLAHACRTGRVPPANVRVEDTLTRVRSKRRAEIGYQRDIPVVNVTVPFSCSGRVPAPLLHLDFQLIGG